MLNEQYIQQQEANKTSCNKHQIVELAGIILNSIMCTNLGEVNSLFPLLGVEKINTRWVLELMQPTNPYVKISDRGPKFEIIKLQLRS